LNWIDWIIIGVLVLSSLQGLRSGLIASVAGLAGIVSGLWVAFNYHHTLAAYVSGRWNVEEKLGSLLEGVFKLWTPDGNRVPPGLPGEGSLTAGMSPVDASSNSLSNYLVGTFAAGVLDVFCFLVLVIAVAWLVGLAGRLLTGIAGWCFMGPLNRAAGVLFGAARGIAIVVIIIILLSPFQIFGISPGILPEEHTFRLPGETLRDSKLLPCFEPFFEFINRPLPLGDGTYNIG